MLVMLPESWRKYVKKESLSKIDKIFSITSKDVFVAFLDDRVRKVKGEVLEIDTCEGFMLFQELSRATIKRASCNRVLCDVTPVEAELDTLAYTPDFVEEIHNV